MSWGVGQLYKAQRKQKNTKKKQTKTITQQWQYLQM
jgi:hypothetical protein